MKKTILATGALLAGIFSTSAFAANNRTWISGNGVDQAGCGPVAMPCRTLQYAHDNTNAGGEINVLDPAGYGSVAIDKAISIINDGVGTAGVLATSGNAIQISAGSTDAVILRGLTIEGANTASNGIRINGVGSLTIANCVIQGFTGRGILDFSGFNGTLRVLNTTVAGNHDGILIAPAGNITSYDALLDRVVVVDNASNGLQVAGDNSFGSGTLRVAVSNSLLSSNASGGLNVYSNTLQANVVITDSIMSGNGNGAAIRGILPSIVTFGRNTIAHNNVGINIFNGTANTFGNNQFHNNSGDVSGTLTPVSQQ